MSKQKVSCIFSEMWVLIIYLFIFFFSPLFSFSQQPNNEFENYTVEDGLSSNSISCMAQDSHEFLWIGTEDGLNRFDGYHFRTYRKNENDSNSLSGNYINGLWTDSQDNIWVRTNDNTLNRLSPETNKITQFKKIFDSAGIPSNKIRSMFIDSKNILWVGTYQNGICRLPLSALKNEASHPKIKYSEVDTTSVESNFILSVTEDMVGNIWVIDFYGHLYKLKNRDTSTELSFEYFNSRLLIDDKNSFIPIYDISETTNGNFWIATDKEIIFLHPVKGIIKRWRLDLNYSTVKFKFSKSNIWIPGSRDIFCIDKSTLKLTTYKYDSENPFSAVFHCGRAFFLDRSDHVWSGSVSGLSRYNSGSKKIWGSRIYPNSINAIDRNRVRCIAENDSDMVWLGTDSYGIYCYDLFKNEYSLLQKVGKQEMQLYDFPIWAILYDGHSGLWMGYKYQALLNYNLKSGTVNSFSHSEADSNSLCGNYIKALVKNKDDEIWIGSNGGLNMYDLKTKKMSAFYFKELDSLYRYANRNVRCIEFGENQNLWIGTEGAGFYRFEYKGENIKPEIKHYDVGNIFSVGIGSNWVNTICKSSTGIIWIGTYGGGLYRFNPITEEFKKYSEASGLPNSVVYGILEDSHSNLWMSTNHGISKFNPTTEKFTNYTPDDGLQGYEYNSGAYFKNKKGYMFFGGTNGWNMFNPDSIKESRYKPEIVFTDFQIYNKSIQPKSNSQFEKDLNYTDHITLTPDQSVFSFEFAALNFTATAKNQYKYFLQGYDKDTQYTGTRRFITFTNLDPGNYLLTLKASNSDGVWSSKIKTLRIDVLPALYQKTWFRFLSAVVILFIIYGIIYWYWRYRQIENEKEKKIRSELESVLHDGVRKDINLVLRSAELADIQIGLNDKEKSRELVQKISKVAWSMDFSLKHLTSDFGNEKISFAFLINLISEYVSISIPDSINLKMSVPDSSESVSVSGSSVWQLLLIVKECLNNMMKHSECKNAELSIHYVNHFIIFELKDDGKGFDESKQERVNGINHIRERANKAGGSVEVISAPGKGTHIKVKVRST